MTWTDITQTEIPTHTNLLLSWSVVVAVVHVMPLLGDGTGRTGAGDTEKGRNTCERRADEIYREQHRVGAYSRARV